HNHHLHNQTTIGSSQTVTIGSGGAGSTGNVGGSAGTASSVGTIVNSGGGTGGGNQAASAIVVASGSSGGTATTPGDLGVADKLIEAIQAQQQQQQQQQQQMAQAQLENQHIVNESLQSKALSDHFLIKQFPQHSNKIKSALTAGFSIDQIVKFLSGGKQALNREEVQGGTEHEITRKRDIQQRENVNKGFGTAAALGASALAAPMAASALSRAIPSSLQTILPNILQQQGFQNTPIPQTQPALVPTNPQQHPINQQIPNNIPQPTIPQQPQINIPQILNNYQGFTKKIDDLLKSGNDIEKISAYFRNFTASQAKKLEKETGLPLEEIVK
ncbi:unnamed protein product, partial [Sphagnum balticum]